MSDFKCTAISVRQASATFYVAGVRAMDLETICRPLKRPTETGLFGRGTAEPIVLSEVQLSSLVRSLESTKFQARTTELLTQDKVLPYQRFLDEKRSVEIARYLEEPSALLPNSIILAVNVDLDESDVVHPKENNLVQIILPRDENSAVILDGQHRVAAFRYLKANLREGLEVTVTFLVGVPFYQQAEIFAVINGKQKPVNKSIIYDLFGYAPIGDGKEDRLYEGLMAVSRFCSHVTRILNGVEESPWRNKVKMRGPGDVGIVSQAAVVEYLSALVEPKTFSNRVKVLPLLYHYFKESDPVGCATLIILYLRAIQTGLPEQWQNMRSLLWKNNGVAVVLRILHDEIMLAGGTHELMNCFRSIVTRWQKAPRDDLNAPPKSGGGGVQNQLYDRFKGIMFSSSELALLNQKRETLKEYLLELGGLVR